MIFVGKLQDDLQDDGDGSLYWGPPKPPCLTGGFAPRTPALNFTENDPQITPKWGPNDLHMILNDR